MKEKSKSDLIKFLLPYVENAPEELSAIINDITARTKKITRNGIADAKRFGRDKKQFNMLTFDNTPTVSIVISGITYKLESEHLRKKILTQLMPQKGIKLRDFGKSEVEEILQKEILRVVNIILLHSLKLNTQKSKPTPYTNKIVRNASDPYNTTNILRRVFLYLSLIHI